MNDLILYFSEFDIPGNHALGLYRALAACRERGARRLLFDVPGVYELDPSFCAERELCISNHGFNGPHRIAVLIENMEDFEIDFGGSRLILPGEATHIAILSSRRVAVRNVTLEDPQCMAMQVRVVAHGDGYVDTEIMQGGEQFDVRRGELTCPKPRRSCNYGVELDVELVGDTGEYMPGTADHNFGARIRDMVCEYLPDGRLRFHGVRRYPPIGNILVISAARRMGAGIFCCDSADVTCSNVTVLSCHGMGFIAQTSRDIRLDGFRTHRPEGLAYSAVADATHFVDCDGSVTVENCVFEGQLDDALNIHGMYTRVIGVEKDALFLREMHRDATGIRIFRDGDSIQVLDQKTLIPFVERVIRKVEYINSEVIRLELEPLSPATADNAGRMPEQEIKPGQVVENISHNVALTFRHNIVRGNRARGMLIASRGRTVIEDCYFHTSGAAVLFEANGEYWFESGGTRDVTIRGCRFDACRHGRWGNAVIECARRKATEEGRYFHRSIRVLDNTFRMADGGAPAAIFDNIESLCFRGNTLIAAPDGTPARVLLSHIGQADIQPDAE